MKRTPLRRSTKPIARRSRLKAKGGSRFPHRRCQPYLDWLKEQPCIVSGLRTGEFIPSMTGRNLFWRVEVQPDNVAQLRHKLWIGAEFERRDAMRL